MFLRFIQNTLPNEKCLTITNTGPLLLESNLEEKTSKSRKRKPSYFVFYFLFVFWKSLYLHMLWDHAFVYFQFLTSICQLCNCGQASGLLRLVGLLSWTLPEQRSSDLCFPAERIHVFGGSYWIDNAKTYSTNTIENTCELQISLTSWTTFAHRRCSLSMEGENKTNHVLLEVPLWFQVLFCTILVQQGRHSPLNNVSEATVLRGNRIWIWSTSMKRDNW